MKLNIKISDKQRAKVNAKYAEFAKCAKDAPGVSTDSGPTSEPSWLKREQMKRAQALSYKYFAR